MTDQAAVLFANEAFYAAFSGRDMEAMKGVWAEGEQITCIHPGWPPLAGRDEVMGSWGSILGGDSSPEITCRSPMAHVFEGFAYVICHEVLLDGALLATNIFCRDGGRWRMVHHQAGTASPMPSRADDEEEATLQ